MIETPDQTARQLAAVVLREVTHRLRGIDGCATHQGTAEEQESRRVTAGVLDQVASWLWRYGETPDASVPHVTCPECRRTSYNPHDIAHGYCGACHKFWRDAP